MFSLAQGKELVQAARKAVLSKFDNKPFKLKGFEEKRGVFVTINGYPDHDLKGCIGFPEPVFPLNDAIVQAAESAASLDPRFAPLEKEDLDKVLFEVSVLTKPELVEVKDAKEYKEKIKIGQDGLVAEQSGYKGLLLPQVAPEHKMDWEEFLSCTCEKAGLPSDAWKDIGSIKIYKFQAQIFEETKPNGKIIESKDF
ncbi:MAG: TIGR00296 family protein [Nanoarchaeota archaeon]|nr:TIGR00296 family protein [Nanoarchaeota archaeon]MCG2718283.1 TIGR00296 family protein [Nanoarchaeota archaeon]